MFHVEQLEPYQAHLLLVDKFHSIETEGFDL
jgi:hypothetical protein